MFGLERRISPDAAFAALGGPRVWADVGRRWTVIAQVEPVPVDDWQALAREAFAAPGGGVPFADGVVGWFGYPGETWLPGCWLGRVTAAARFDRLAGEWWVDAAVRERLEEAAEIGEVGAPCGVRVAGEGERERYVAGVRRILEHLRAGDCYQVNLAREVRATGVGPAFDIWRRLRAANPARRGVFLDVPEGAVVCNSPELLLRVRNRRVRSVPIKGTAPRSGGADAAQALLRSAKERAELTMIVDLVRADLGWVSRPGSVVAGPRRVGAVGHVWHAMQAVEAELDEGKDAVDAFTALFPAGSVTGAPRLRAMEVIRSLEVRPRGVYCGSIGWFGGGGDAWWNVAIRTVAVRDGEARLHVGAGIVLGSDPEREWRETELKAERMLGAVVG